MDTLYVAARNARAVYESLLNHLRDIRAPRSVWVALPREVDAWWRRRSLLKLVQHDRKWGIEGPGSERATVAFARLRGGELLYELGDSTGAHTS